MSVTMIYNHNAEADFAASEIARLFVANPLLCYDAAAVPTSLSASASYESSSAGWPKADGLISVLESGSNAQRDIALEYKRQQEGIHGLLTAIGQGHAYLHKGYSGAAIVVPRRYSTHSFPGEYIRDVLNSSSRNRAIGVFIYDEPDTSSVTPFADRIECVHPMVLSQTVSRIRPASTTPKTQWVHMREGSTTRDGFFRFLQSAKRISSDSSPLVANIPQPLVDAIQRIAPNRNPVEYLANIADNKFLSKVWQAFWFEWLITPEVLTPWLQENDIYVTPNAMTRILKDDGTGYSQMFEGRSNGLKETIVNMLNLGQISEERGWELFARGIAAAPGSQRKQGIRDRAHSYREDIDSSLAQLQWIERDGFPTDQGYRYMTICERYGGANSAAAVDYVGATLLQTGRYVSFLHYVHRLSERIFSADPLAYTRTGQNGLPVFNEDSYWEYLEFIESQLTNELRVMRKVSGRARPRIRTQFQAELTLLRNYKFVSSARYRLGVGIPIDWEQVVQALNVDL